MLYLPQKVSLRMKDLWAFITQVFAHPPEEDLWGRAFDNGKGQLGLMEYVRQGKLISVASPHQFVPPSFVELLDGFGVLSYQHFTPVQPIVVRVAFSKVAVHLALYGYNVVLPKGKAVGGFLIDAIVTPAMRKDSEVLAVQHVYDLPWVDHKGYIGVYPD